MRRTPESTMAYTPCFTAIRRAAVIVGVDPRTVLKLARGEPVRGMAARARAQAALEMAREASFPTPRFDQFDRP